MGLFDAFKKVTKAIVDTALIPVDVAVDVVTMGRALEDDEPATWERLKKIKDDLQDAYNELND